MLSLCLFPKRRHFFLLNLLFPLCLLSLQSHGQGRFSAIASGNWTNPASWSRVSGTDAGSNGYPDGADTAVFLASTAGTVSISVTASVSVGGLWINGSTVSDGTHEVVVSGASVVTNFTIGAAGLIVAEGNSATRIARFAGSGVLANVQLNGDLTMQGAVPAASVLSITSSAVLNLTGNCNMNSGGSTFFSTGGTLRFNGTTEQIIIGSITVSNLGVLKSNSTPVVAGGVINATSTQISGNSRLNLGTYAGHSLGNVSGTGSLMISAPNKGNTVFPSGIYTSFLAPASTGTIEYFGDDTINIDGVTPAGRHYYNLVFSGSGVKTITSPIMVKNIMTVNPEAIVKSAGVTTEITDGHLVVNGVLNYSESLSSVLMFSNKTAAQNISGTGTIKFRDLYLDKTNYALSLQQSISVMGTLQWQSDGFLDLNTKDLILGPTSTLTPNGSFDSTCMVRMDGTSGPGSMVKMGTNSTQLMGTFPIGTLTSGANRYTPAIISTLNCTINSGDTATISIKTIPFTSALPDILRRFWRVQKTKIATITDARIAFLFRPVDKSGIPDYISRTASLVTNGVPSSYIASDRFGVNTSGNIFLEEDWGLTKQSALPKTYYSFQNGNWSVPSTWTTDPSGLTSAGLPAAGGPNNFDRVVILPRDTVVMDQNSKTLGGVSVKSGGQLNIGATTGHGFSQLIGKGHVRIASITLPTGDYSDFVEADSGTFEYNVPSSFTLPSSMATYNNLIINLNDTVSTATLLHNLTINGSLTIARGVFTINNTGSVRLSVSIAKDLLVNTNGRIKVGTGNTNTFGPTGTPTSAGQYFNIYHSLSIGRNFTNNGKIRFTNLTQPVLNQNSSTGAVNVFLTGATNGTVTLNGPTDFQNLILDKNSYLNQVDLVSAHQTYFRLFGRVDLPNIGTTGDPEVRKSLSLNQGTLSLQGNILIPTLTEAQGSTVGTAAPANYGPHYTIPNRSHLILNGAGVSVFITADNQSNTQVGALMAANLTTWTGGDEGIMLQGSLTITNGTLNGRNGAGIIYRPTGGNRGVTLTNGTVRLTQFRNFAGVTGNFFYQQDGGSLEIVGLGFGGLGYSTGQAAFSMASSGHSFHMSGGTLLLSGARASAIGNNPFLFDIQAVSSTVTGGLIDIAPDSVWSFGTRIYELNQGGSARIFNLSTRKVRGSVTLRARSTFTLNGTLTVGANTSLQMRNNTLNIGKDFILNGGYFQHTDPVTSGASPLRFRAYVLGADQNMVINEGATFDFSDFELRPWEPSPVANLLLVSGTLASKAFTVRNFRFFNGCIFNDGGFAITVTGELESWGSPTHIGTGKLIFNCTRGTIFNIRGNAGLMNVDLNDPDGYQMINSAFTISGTVNYNSNSVFNMDVYELRLAATANINITSPSASKMFQHSGSATQGGIRRYFSPTGGTFTYHIGTIGKYRPATVSFTATAARELLIRPISGEHPNTVFSSKAIQYHWKYFFNSSTGISNLTFTNSYNDVDILPAQTDNAYKVGRWIGSGWAVTTYATQATNTFSLVLGSTNTNFDLTAGGDSAYMAISTNTFVSRQSGNWHTPSTWRIINGNTNAVIQDPATTLPSPVNPVRIAASHSVTVNDNTPIDIPSVQFNAGSTLDFKNTCDFVVHTMGIVSINAVTALAPARVRVTTSSSDSTKFPGGNWAPFLNNGQANVFLQFYYSGTNFRIPNYSQLNQNQLANLAGLEIDHGSGQIQLPNQSIIMNSFNVFSSSGTGGRCFNSTETALREIRISNNWTIGNNGHFQFSSRAGMIRRDHWITGNNASCTLSVAPTGRLSVESDAGSYQQYLWFNEGFTNEGTIDFMPVSASQARVWMCVQSSRNTTFQGAGTTRVPMLYIDRNARTTSVTNSNSGFVFANTPTGGTTNLQLVTGTYIQNHSNINWVIKTGNNPTEYSINANSHLIIRAGTASINATGTNAGLRVDGRLTIDGTGKLRLASNNGVDNYLGIGTAGASLTIATSDSVIVGSQLKGIGMVAAPNFTMRSGTLLIGRQGAPDLTRGMFAVSGTNSKFKVTGGRIIVMRSVGQPSVFDVNIQPDSTPVYTGGSFQIGSSLMASNANFLVRNSHGFNNLRLVNSGSLNPRLDNRNFNLTVFGNDTIDAGTTCLMNDLDLNIGGNLVKNGTYTGGTGTLRFNGSGSTQNLSGSGTLTCTNFESANTNGTASVLSVDIPVTVNTALTVSSLDNVSIGSNTLSVSRTVTNNGQISTSSGKLLLNGTLKQIMTGTNAAQFGKTEFANSAGFDIQRSFVFNGDVVLTTGIIDLISNQMTLGQNANFQGTGFGTTKFIKVSGTLSDAGITKNFAAGAASILIPVGVNPSIGVVKYTPAFFNIQQNTAVSSSITVRAINDKHPNTLSSNNSELKYYWKVDTTGFANLQADMTFRYDQSDANTRGNENDYDPARYGSNGNWATGGSIGTIDVGSNIIIVDGGNTGYVTFIGGDFTAGEPDEFISLIPYLTNGTGGGNWEVASTWALNVVPVSGSAIRVVGTDVLTVTANTKTASAVILEDAATLNLASTTGHNLGTILGKGKITLATANLPAGNYATFTQAGGGTIEYRGSVTLPVTRVVYNNLIINIPSGVASIPNASLTINGNLTVQNGTLQSLTNRRIILYGNLVIESGSTFIAGNSSSNEQFRLSGNLTNNGTFTSGNTRFVLFGGQNQYIGGTLIPVLNYLEMGKSARKAYLVNNLRLQTQLAFSSGVLVLGAYNLVLNNNTLLADPDALSYVQAEQSGKIIRPISTVPVNASYAVYPVGDAVSYKPITIQLNSAVLSGGAQLEVNLTSAPHPGMSTDVTRYLPYYWSVKPTGMSSPYSYNISYTTGQHSDMILVRDSDPNPIKAYKWDSELGWLKGGSYNQTTAVFTWNGITSFSDFTGGTQLEELPLPVHLISFTGHMDARRKVITQWQTASERNMSHFTVERLDARGNVTALGKIQPMSRMKNQENGGFHYQFTDADPVEGRGYYRLKMVDLDGSYSYSATIAVQLSMEGQVKHYPNPLHHSAVTIDFPAGENSDLDWKILDATGREIVKGNLEANGSRTVSIEETKDLLPGFYFIHLEKGEVKTNLRIMVQ